MSVARVPAVVSAEDIVAVVAASATMSADAHAAGSGPHIAGSALRASLRLRLFPALRLLLHLLLRLALRLLLQVLLCPQLGLPRPLSRLSVSLLFLLRLFLSLLLCELPEFPTDPNRLGYRHDKHHAGKGLFEAVEHLG